MLKHLQQLALDHADFVDDRIGASERLPTPVSFRMKGVWRRSRPRRPRSGVLREYLRTADFPCKRYHKASNENQNGRLEDMFVHLHAVLRGNANAGAVFTKESLDKLIDDSLLHHDCAPRGARLPASATRRQGLYRHACITMC